jgi:hypothetical protein
MTVSKQFIRNLFLVFGICLLGYLFFMNLIKPHAQSGGDRLFWYLRTCSKSINQMLQNGASSQEIQTCEGIVDSQSASQLQSKSRRFVSRVVFSNDTKTYQITAEEQVQNYYFPFIMETKWKLNRQFEIPKT